MGNETPSDLIERHAVGHVEVLTVRVAEVVAAETIQPLAQQIRIAFRTSSATTFILDLSGVRFLTSGALGMIIHLRSQLLDQARELILAGGAGEVARTLTCTRLAEIMPVYESVESAIRSARRAPDALDERRDDPA